MAKKRGRRDRQTHLFAVPDAATEPVSAGDDPQLVFVREQLAAAGAPADVLESIESAADAAGLVAEMLTGLDDAAEITFDEMLSGWASLLEPDADALDAELAGAEMLGMLGQANEWAGGSERDLAAILTGLAEMGEASGRREALAMLRSLAALGPHEAVAAMCAAADRMAAAGLQDVPWAGQLDSLTVGEAFSYGSEAVGQEVIAFACEYPGAPHTANVLIDYDLGGGVKDCYFGSDPDLTRRDYERLGRESGIDVHDLPRGVAHETLTRAFAAAPCPTDPDQVDDVASYLPSMRRRVELLRAALAPRRQRTQPETAHRLKIALRGAKPPIWRRIEVPSAVSLEMLHECIQAAFGWDGGHLWMFDTPRGRFGPADFELDCADAASRRLSDVAPTARTRIRYTYDFGDDWEHDVLVEDVGPTDSAVRYPRCTGGRRACPPEDCGGVWGYEELRRILADVDDDEHAAMLEWLGLDSPSDFDPAEFDAAAANRRLSGR